MSAPESEHLRRTEEAQRVLRGEAPPPLVLDARLGMALDLATGAVVCPSCGWDGVDLLSAIEQPFGAPTRAGIFMRCASCGQAFAIEVAQKDGRALLRTQVARV